MPLFLTFDDGPDENWTPIVLDMLALRRMSATFFVVGQLARAQAVILRRAAAEGHSIGNHTWSHRHPWAMNAAHARQEVRDGTAAIADVLGTPPSAFRPPHGRLRTCMLEQARAQGQALTLWSLSAQDWGVFGRASGIATRLSRTSADDVVLMHDGQLRSNRPDQLIRVLPTFLDRLCAQGIATNVF